MSEPAWLTDEMVELADNAAWSGDLRLPRAGLRNAITTLAADTAFQDAIIRERVAEIQEVPGPRSWMYGHPHMKVNGAWCHSVGILTALNVAPTEADRA